MAVTAGWMQQNQSGISFDELSSLIAELVACFEQQQVDYPTSHADWISPSSRTQVIRHGCSTFLNSVLNQAADTVSAEYEVLYRGSRVFTWQEYLWPQLRKDNQDYRNSKIYLPQGCLDELMAFHVANDTLWLKRYRCKLQSSRAIEIDKVGVVAQANCIELS